jgi:hypothetical protein
MTETPPNLLMEFVLSLLTPFLMTEGITDIDLARRATAETIAAYKVTGQDQLVTIAQIIAFALTSLDNLRLSLPPDLSLSMKLKLRGNASALNRASQQATATLETRRRETPAPEPDLDPAEILAALETAKAVVQQAQAATQAQTATPATRQNIPDRQTDAAWAAAMTGVAAEYTAELPNLTPAERGVQLARIAALSKIATSLGNGTAPPLKARLLGSTTMQG